MTRVLVFDAPKGATRFSMLRIALLNAGDGDGPRVPATIRKEARLQDALDSISDPQPTEADAEARVLKNHGVPELTLQQEDFDLLSQYAEKCKWTPRAARAAVDLWDFMSAAERRD